MPAKYFPSLSPNGIDYNTLPNLGDIAQAPRGQDPMHYGFTGSKGPQSPFAPMVGQAADALMDPRVGMLPMVGGFRAVGGMAPKLGQAMEKQIARRVEAGILKKDEPYLQSNHDLTMEMQKAKFPIYGMEGEAMPHQQATIMRQPQGDQSMGKAIQGLAESMGWSSEKMADWLVQNGFRSGR